MLKKIIIVIFIISCVFSLIAENSKAIYETQISSKIAELELDDILCLWITDADTGYPVIGAEVVLDSITIYTNKDGLAQFPIDSVDEGENEFYVKKEGYMILHDIFIVFGGSIFFNKFSIPKKLEMKNIKVVLDWGSYPLDIDAHLIKKNEYHISYRNMRKNKDGSVWLDIDARNGYGPETITITEFDAIGIYTYFIHNYENKDITGNINLSNSGAVIRVYINNELKHVIRAMKNKKGNYWKVFEIKNGTIYEINEYIDNIP